jgi:broad specificity phosphatase PhoE
MTTFYICRHGETENNKIQRLSGWADTPLTESGVRQAASSAKKLTGIKIDKIISSDLGRALTTAQLIAKELGYSAEIEAYKDLREVNYGDLANKPYSAYPDLSTEENTTYVPTNGESLYHMQARVIDCINQIASQNPDKTILIVAHDGTINALRANFSNESMGKADLAHNPHDVVAKFSMQAGKVTSFDVL